MTRRRETRRTAPPPDASAAAPPPLVECADDVRADELETGAWFVQLRADRIPHLALLEDGTCWSLEHDGLRRYSAAQLWRLIHARRVPSLLCRLDARGAGPALPFFERHVARGLDGDVDCFAPLRDFIVSWFPEAAAHEYAFEILPLLAARGRVLRSAALHLPNAGPGRPFALPVYDRADIRERIAQVRRSRDGQR